MPAPFSKGATVKGAMAHGGRLAGRGKGRGKGRHKRRRGRK